MHFTRSLDFPIYSDELRHFDDAVDMVIFNSLSLQSSKIEDKWLQHIGTLRSLPTSLGGLGIYRYSAIHGYASTVRAQDRFQKFLDKYPVYDKARDFSSFLSSSSYRDSPAESSSLPIFINITNISKMVEEKLLSVADCFHKELIDSGRLDAAAWFISSRFPTSGSWLSAWSGMFIPPSYFTTILYSSS